MSKTIRTPDLTFKTHRIRSVFSEVLASDNQLAVDVARPLFEAGVDMAVLTERRNHPAGGSSRRTYHDLTILLQGELRTVLDGQAYDMKPGDLAVCPAGTSMEWSTGETGAWMLYFGILDIPTWAPLKKHGSYVRPYESAARLFLLLRDTLDAVASRQPVAIARAQDCCWAMLDLLRHEMVRFEMQDSKRASSLQQLVDAIAIAPARPWTRQDLAAALHLSVSQTTRLFHRVLGISPQEVVIRHRMQHATRLLTNTHRKIASIAAEVGYDSLHSFTRLFTRRVGMSPGKYRARFAPYAAPPSQSSR